MGEAGPTSSASRRVGSCPLLLFDMFDLLFELVRAQEIQAFYCYQANANTNTNLNVLTVLSSCRYIILIH